MYEAEHLSGRPAKSKITSRMRPHQSRPVLPCGLLLSHLSHGKVYNSLFYYGWTSQKSGSHGIVSQAKQEDDKIQSNLPQFSSLSCSACVIVGEMKLHERSWSKESTFGK